MVSAPRIALWGAFDVEDAGHLLTPRVVGAELVRRLPGATVTTLSPLGRLRPLALDGGRAAEPLGPASAERRCALAGGADCVLVCGEDVLVTPERAAQLWGDTGETQASAALLVDGLSEELEAACPVVWAGVALAEDPDPALAGRIAAVASRRGPVAVLDGRSRQRLSAAAPEVEAEVLPPWSLLLPRLLGDTTLDARAGLMRLLGWAWDGGPVISIHGDRELLGEVGMLAAALLPLVESGAAAVQLAAPGRLRGEEEFAAALEAALGGRCRRLPAEAQLEDQVAVLRCSAAFLGPEGLGLQVARALRLRSAALPLAEPGAAVLRLLDPDTPRPAPPREAIARLDGYLDRLAGLARVAAARRAAAGPGAAPATLPAAHRALGLRLFAERRALQEALDGEVRRLEAELGAARAESDRLRAELGAARAANDAIVGSRTWRYSQPVRDTLARVRERRR